MHTPYTILAGKTVKRLAALRGGGSALPGLFIEKIDPEFIKRTLEALPGGIVVVSGTNGKTTTTKMVVELLRSQNLKVFTNKTGSNFTRGVAAALLGEVDSRGVLDADIAVLELDEAHAVHFVRMVQPKYSLLLNVMRDQLDRFGEIDTTAGMLQKIAEATKDTVIINREDPRLTKFSSSLKNVEYYGLSDTLASLFPNDDSMRSTSKSEVAPSPAATVILESINGQSATFTIDKTLQTFHLKLDGVYNMYNAAGALTLVKTIVGKNINEKKLYTALEAVTPAFGRGEILKLHDQPIELVLVKNPGGFRLGLKSFNPKGYATMIAINDNYADGRDMSWLWDVDFESLGAHGVAMISGSRAYDMAVRLQYDEIDVASVEPDLRRALKKFIESKRDEPKRIYCTYTAMLAIRKQLSKITDVEAIS